MAATNPFQKFNALTNRQKEVLRLVCKGTLYKTIGEKLFISENTVRAHMGNIYEKLGLTHLERSQRIAIIHEIYCPLLNESSAALIPVEEDAEPEPIPPEVEWMVKEDEYSLMRLDSSEIVDGEIVKISSKPRRRFLWIMIFVVICGALVAGGFFFFDWNQLGFLRPAAQAPQQAASSATPVVVVVTATDRPVSPTPKPRATNTLSPTRVPPTKTPVYPTKKPDPTKTNIPVSGGIGTWVGNEDLQIKLLDYEFRSINNEVDEGAVNVYLSLINNTNNEVEVQINWFIVEGIDNVGIKYGEIYSVGDRYLSWSNAQEKLENWSIVVPANSIELVDFELQVEDNNSGHITRVDIRTDWIDLRIPSIVYRTDKLYQVMGKWRLDR